MCFTHGKYVVLAQFHVITCGIHVVFPVRERSLIDHSVCLKSHLSRLLTNRITTSGGPRTLSRSCPIRVVCTWRPSQRFQRPTALAGGHSCSTPRCVQVRSGHHGQVANLSSHKTILFAQFPLAPVFGFYGNQLPHGDERQEEAGRPAVHSTRRTAAEDPQGTNGSH